MRITKKQLANLIKETIKEASEYEDARYAMQSALNDPSTRIDRGLWADVYRNAREEDSSRTPAAPAAPTSKTAAASRPESAASSRSKAGAEADLDNPMIASLFSPQELQQIRQGVRAGGAAASRAADQVSEKLSSAADEMRNLAKRFGLMEESIRNEFLAKIIREEIKKTLASK